MPSVGVVEEGNDRLHYVAYAKERAADGEGVTASLPLHGRVRLAGQALDQGVGVVRRIGVLVGNADLPAVALADREVVAVVLGEDVLNPTAVADGGQVTEEDLLAARGVAGPVSGFSTTVCAS